MEGEGLPESEVLLVPNFIFLLLIVAVAFFGITYLMHVAFHHRLVKYIPVLFALGIGLQNIYLARYAPSEGFQDIARVIVVIMAIAGLLGSLSTALYIDYVLLKKKPR